MLRDKELLLYRGFNHGDILEDASELIYEYEFGYDSLKVKSLSCLTLYNPIESSLPCSSIDGIF